MNGDYFLNIFGIWTDSFNLVFSTRFIYLFLFFYFVHLLVEVTLEIINYRHTKKQLEVPEEFIGRVTQTNYRRSRDYTLEKSRFGLTAQIAQIPFFWLLVFENGFNTFDYYAALYGGYGTLTHSVLFGVFIGLFFAVIGLPFRLYSVFVIEEKYGFNKMTFGLFLVDLVKTIFLSLIIGVPLMYAVYWFMKQSGSMWWLWVWCLIMGFQIFMAGVYPVFIAPIFNKMNPLKEGDLKKSIFDLAKKISFSLSDIMVIDGSKRSSHSNAYFAGLGRFRRIVLFDTIMKQLTERELLGVLAHEMGHNVKKHILKSMILMSGLSLIGFYVLSKLMAWPEFFKAFNISDPSIHAGLVLFAIVSETFTFFLTPLMNLLSRKNEFEADQFSVELLGEAAPLQSALLKLSQENLSNLNPHSWYSFYYYSHPTLIERSRAMEKVVR